MCSLLKLSTFPFCFKNFSISLYISGDLQDGPEPQLAVIAVQHQPSSNPSSIELSPWIVSAFPIGTACLALTQAGLTLAAEDGEGTQAGFQFFPTLGTACS